MVTAWQAGKVTSSPHYGLTVKYFWVSLDGMANLEKPPLKRLNITFTNHSVEEVETLRALLEQRLKQRMSIAQVMKRLVKYALEQELNSNIAKL